MNEIGALPEYIPPHLNGQVMDFRAEPDGKISFYHPEASKGLDPESSRVKISPEEYDQTFDQQHRRGDFTDSMNGQYALRRPKSESQKINDAVAGKIRSAYEWGTSSQGKGVGTAALLAALGGAAGGYMWGNYTGEGKMKKSLLMALLAGGVGAGTTALAQRQHNTREAFYQNKQASSDTQHVLIRALENDPTVSASERAMLLRELARVPDQQRDELYHLLRTTIGAGAGMLVMRFLKAKGLLPMMAGAILGGMAGSASGRSPEYNAMGQRQTTQYT